ncbi:hypothetical protein QBC40DRAFT_330363 [Triangularia verruculosa]|uniref:Nephrocystin 3-like N-terminal domain-containing protein n=1 Tax=Triangularia verruculosa TaxID=2587418 RepID=A0AAN6XJD7_9PEZI|nr:hypothetical protein QBC40DRAFT_330363 [Triangularia verruculosa]
MDLLLQPSSDQRHRLLFLSEGSLATQAQGCDIIFVHGLLPHSPQTLQDTGLSWSRDILPLHLPWARTYRYLFEYNPSAHNQHNDCGISEATDSLLVELEARTRTAKEPRPILFIAHSIAGLVVKSALVKAYENRDEECCNEIITATTGIIFLGTPHTLASPTELETIMVRVFPAAVPVTMVAVQVMFGIMQQFLMLPWTSIPWKVVSFHETLSMPGTDTLAVESDHMRLSAFPNVPMTGTHHDLCRFDAQKDRESYVKLVECLKDFRMSRPSSIHLEPTVTDHELSPNMETVLKSLRPGDRDIPNFTSEPYEGTLDWLSRNDVYRGWMDRPGMLWISGKPGSGKSTLLQYIINRIPVQEATDLHVISFTFSPAKKTMSTLLTSTLHQLLMSTTGYPTTEVLAELSDRKEFLGVDQPWEDDTLSEIVLPMVKKLTSQGHSLYIIIDELDQCEDRVGLESLLLRLGGSAEVEMACRICVASRYAPSFTLPWQLCLDNYNSSDIQKYLREHSKLSPIHEEQILRKAQGSFLWLRIAVSFLFDNSTSFGFEVSSLLPTKLDLLLDRVLRRLEQVQTISSPNTDIRRFSSIPPTLNCPGQTFVSTPVVSNLFILALYALKPLTLSEVRGFLEVAGDMPSGVGNGHKKAVETTDTWLSSLSGGLLQLSSRGSGSSSGRGKLSQPTVHFIHSTVRDYLLARTCKMDSHFRIAQICLNHINMNWSPLPQEVSVPNEGSPSFFLPYAVSYGILHLRLAIEEGLTVEGVNASGGIPWQPSFLDQWAGLHRQLSTKQTLFEEGRAAAVHVMAYFDIQWFHTDLWGFCSGDVHIQDRCGRTPLFIAAAMGHVKVCDTLIALGAKVDHQDHIYGQSALHLAADQGQTDVVRLLLQRGADCNVRGSVTPLWMATRSARVDIVEMLLQGGADPQAANMHTGETPLSRAAALGHIPIVRLLVQSGGRLDAVDARGWTPLHHAVQNGRKKTLEVLLEELEKYPAAPRLLSANQTKSENSWVNTVLLALLYGLGHSEKGQSQESPRDGRGSANTKTGAKPKGQVTAPMQKRERRGEGDVSDEDEAEEDNRSTKRPRSEGHRLVCPYFRKNPEVFASTPGCRGSFQDINRLRAHIKKCHNQAFRWQRCHICEERFAPNEIKGHQPCIAKDKPSDYERGIDGFQYAELTSLRGGTGKECWDAIFRILFPNWPKERQLPDAYESNKSTIKEAINLLGQEQVETILLQALEQHNNQNIGGRISASSSSLDETQTVADTKATPITNVMPSFDQVTPRLDSNDTHPQMPLFAHSSNIPFGKTTGGQGHLERAASRYIPPPETPVYGLTPLNKSHGNSMSSLGAGSFFSGIGASTTNTTLSEQGLDLSAYGSLPSTNYQDPIPHHFLASQGAVNLQYYNPASWGLRQSGAPQTGFQQEAVPPNHLAPSNVFHIALTPQDSPHNPSLTTNSQGEQNLAAPQQTPGAANAGAFEQYPLSGSGGNGQDALSGNGTGGFGQYSPAGTNSGFGQYQPPGDNGGFGE